MPIKDKEKQRAAVRKAVNKLHNTRRAAGLCPQCGQPLIQRKDTAGD